MKICFIAPKAYQLFNEKVETKFGGSQVQLALLAKEFAKNTALEIHFIVADYGQKNVEEYDGVKVWKSLNFKKNTLSHFWCFLKIFVKINADIYVFRSLNVFSGLISMLCFFWKKKTVYMLANDGEADFTHRQYQGFLKKIVSKWVFRYSDVIITQNQYQQEKLKERKVKSRILKSVYEILDLEKIEKENYHLWVGRYDSLKRPELFVQLATALPKENFVMICPHSTHSSQIDFEKMLAEIKPLSNLKYYNFVAFSQIDSYFRKAKTFVNTSFQEGFPNTFIQATKNATPIVSLNVNPDDFLNTYKCGFFCEDDFEVLKQYLQETESNIWKQFSENAYQYAKENHDIEVNAEKLLELIKA